MCAKLVSGLVHLCAGLLLGAVREPVHSVGSRPMLRPTGGTTANVSQRQKALVFVADVCAKCSCGDRVKLAAYHAHLSAVFACRDTNRCLSYMVDLTLFVRPSVRKRAHTRTQKTQASLNSETSTSISTSFSKTKSCVFFFNYCAS